MRQPRKTKKEKSQEWAKAEVRQWKQFSSKLEAVQSWDDVKQLISEAPSTDSPGRRYYTELILFLEKYTLRAESDTAEITIYIKLIRKLESWGKLGPGIREKAEESLKQTLSQYN